MGINIFKLNPFSKIAGRELVGIDFSSSFLKIVYLRSSLQKIEVLNLISKEINNLSDEDIAKIIRNLFAELKVKDPVVVNVIPSQLAITKNIEIPSCDPQEIKEIISLQAGRHTPYSREEILVDYVQLGTFKNSYTKILLVIVARNIIKRYYEILTRAGLRLEKISFAPEGLSLSALKALKLGSDNIPAAVVNIDDSFTDFVIIYKNRPLFVRGISIGFGHLNSEHGQVYKTKFVEELKKTFESYQGEALEKAPNILALTGAALETLGLEALLSDSLHMPVKTIPYLSNISVSHNILKASFTKNVSYLNLISSLAAYDELKIDLTLEDIKLRKAIEARGKDLVTGASFVLADFILIFLILIGKIYFKSACLKNLDSKYESLNEQAQKLEKDYSKISLIRGCLLSRGYSLETLIELYNIVPQDLQISDIRLDEQGRFLLSGTARSMSTVFSFVSSMEKSRYFKDVKTKHTTKRKEGPDEVADFEIASLVDKEQG